MSGLTLIAEVLRRPAQVVERIEREGTLAVDGPRLLAAFAGGAALFGFVIGMDRSPLQGMFAALKLPVLLLLPLMLVLPALPALWRACDVEVAYGRLAVASLVGATRAAVLAAAAAPVWWLAAPLLDYHVAVLAFAGALAAVGAPGLWVVGEAIPAGGRDRWLARVGTLAFLGLATMQTGWMLRPFVARPHGEVVLFRTVEQDVFQSLGTTARSSVGVYDTPSEDTGW